jgi:hypothetical protein
VKRCSLEIIDELLASPAGKFFAEPVDWEGLGLVDYPKVPFVASCRMVALKAICNSY